MRLLLVEDSIPLVDELMPHLKRAGYAVDWIVDGRDACNKPGTEDYDIAILDLGLPGISGLNVLQSWRSARLTFPVLVLTARDTFAERIEGLRAGADDYLTKPFHPDELLLRLQTLLRRLHGQINQPQLSAGGFILDEQQQCVLQGATRLELSGIEFRLLRYFMLNPNRIMSRSQLEQHIYDGESEPGSNALEVHINRLRRKLGREVIETRRGQGYCFRGEQPSAGD